MPQTIPLRRTSAGMQNSPDLQQRLADRFATCFAAAVGGMPAAAEAPKSRGETLRLLHSAGVDVFSDEVQALDDDGLRALLAQHNDEVLAGKRLANGQPAPQPQQPAQTFSASHGTGKRGVPVANPKMVAALKRTNPTLHARYAPAAAYVAGDVKTFSAADPAPAAKLSARGQRVVAAVRQARKYGFGG